MNASVMFWVGAAVLVFWAIGAYNRLVRLRSRVASAFAALALVDEQCIGLAKAQGLVMDAQGLAQQPLSEDVYVNAWQAFAAAVEQFNVSLKAAQAHPLDGLRLGALATARAALDLSWERLSKLVPDPAVLVLPTEFCTQWAQLSVQAGLAQTEFNRREVDYNEAVGQFPALLLAWLFDFRPTQSIH